MANSSVKKIIQERIKYLNDTLGISQVQIAERVHKYLDMSQDKTLQKIRDIKTGRSSGDAYFLEQLDKCFPDELQGKKANITYLEDRIAALERKLKTISEENQKERDRLFRIIENLTKSK